MNRELYRWIVILLLLAAILALYADIRHTPSVGAAERETVCIEENKEPRTQEAPAEEPMEEIPDENLLDCREQIYPVPLDADLQAHIVSKSGEYGIDPAIIFSMIDRESKYKIDAVGDGGHSIGLMQIQPRWHEDRMEQLGISDISDPYQNVAVGIDYLSELLEKYGDMEMALVGYNAGPTGAKKQYFDRGVYSSKYSMEVMENSDKLREGVQIVLQQ